MTTRPLAALTAGALCLTPAAALAAKPKSDGTYRQFILATKTEVSVRVVKHKIADGQVSTVLKKHGKRCSPPGETGTGPTAVDFTPKHAVTPSKTGAFDFEASGEIQHGKHPHTTVSVSGKFTSATHAKISVDVSYKGCKATATVRKAAFSQQGS